MEEIKNSKICRLNRSPIRKRKREIGYEDDDFQKRTKKDDNDDCNYYCWIVFGLVLFGYYYF